MRPRPNRVIEANMQGTFEAQDEEEEDADHYSDHDETEQHDPRPFAASAKRSRHLDANVPWASHLIPENDRETQRNMEIHREREIKYSVLSDERKQFAAKVIPYPETPDRVFPGTPCYKILLNGRYARVFVIERPEAGWTGGARPQSRAYWIVSHFLYRPEQDVNARKERYKKFFEENILQNWDRPTDKLDFNSTGVPSIPVRDQNPNDCYYAHAQQNPNTEAPDVIDPLWSPPFRRGAIQRYRAYPYNQPKDIFPQRPNPPIVMAPPPAPPGGAGPAAGRGPVARGGAAAGRVRPAPAVPPGLPAAPGGGPPRMVPVAPPLALLDTVPPTYEGVNGVDYVTVDPINIEIGSQYLRDLCEQAEEIDYGFALKIQGLKGSSLPAVWNCTDPEYDVTDRKALLAQFVRLYIDKFYGSVSVHGPADAEEIVEHALMMHQDFCRGWVERHHRTLSPEITSASEALVGMFYDDMKRTFPQGLNFTRSHLSTYLRRHPDYSSEFAHCLYHFMTSLEQMRGNRNPSYRAMQNERLTNISATKKIASLLHEKFNFIKTDLQVITNLDLTFHPWFIDWHYIASQLPPHHREFHGYAQNFGFFGTRSGGRGNAFPPWQQMRISR